MAWHVGGPERIRSLEGLNPRNQAGPPGWDGSCYDPGLYSRATATTMRVLLDTNLVIGREDDAPPPTALTSVLRIFSQNAVQTLVHPATRTELLGDRDEERRKTVLAKLGAYSELQSPPEPPPEFKAESRERQNDHDSVDSQLLYAVKADAVDFLLTQDDGLIDRATYVGLDSRVLNLRAALILFSQVFSVRLPPLPQYVHRGPINGAWITDPFFDSFKAEYGAESFPTWYAEIARSGRPGVWVVDAAGRLGALMIYKDEHEATESLPRHRRLKICSFKVAESMQGLRLSERMLWYGFNFMRANGIDEAYVDVLPAHPDLITFFQLFGFRPIGKTPMGEYRLLKRTAPSGLERVGATEPDFSKTFPGFDDSIGVRKFLVPIQASWHGRLFPEYQRNPGQRVLDYYTGTTFNFSPAGNAIRKAYVCRANTNQIRKGDLLLFYRSRDLHRVNEIGIVESTGRRRGGRAVIDMIGNRTVLPMPILEQLSAGEVLVILFWHVGPFPDPRGTGVSLASIGPGTAHPQSISLITDEEYRSLCRQHPAQ